MVSSSGIAQAFKTLLNLFIFGITTLALLSASFAIYFGYLYEKQGPLKAPIEITINSGDNIAARLHDAGIIENELTFKIAARLSNQSKKLQAGEYAVPAGISIKSILNQLVEGKTIQRQITIREGLTNHEILLLLNGSKTLKPSQPQMGYEGLYLPDTYSFQKGDSTSDILEQMRSAMEKTLFEQCKIEAQITKLEDILDYPCGTSPLKTVRDVITLASIVEKETAQADERAKVAGVFINRLRINMPLQTDPTVIYAITEGKHENNGKGPLGRRLLKKDLEIDSPYNTYKNAGLPPGPIANPGRASIEAVLNPEEHKYLYFVADGTGGHAFGKTLKEHNQNVSKWRKIRKNSN